MKISKATAFLNMCIEKSIKLREHMDGHVFYMKRLIKNINFKCNFIDGICERVRANPKNDSPMLQYGCCCGQCFGGIGYLRSIYLDHLSTYAEAWNDKTGFYAIGKGCQLPYELRSKTCLSFACDTAGKKFSDLERAVIAVISNCMYEY